MAATEPRDVVAPTGRRKFRIQLFIAGFLALQLLAPLTYYLREDPYDERFAWRMFSAVRLHSCRTQAFDVEESPERGRVERPVNLVRTIHVAWITTLRRNRRDVVRAFLRRRCEEPGVVRSRVLNHCARPDGSRIEPLVYELDCDSGELSEPEAMP